MAPVIKLAAFHFIMEGTDSTAVIKDLMAKYSRGGAGVVTGST